MNATTTLITCALVAWILQIGLSWLQIRRFNHAFAMMKKGTYLGIGRNKTKRFHARVLIALSFNENHDVIDSIIMQGITVFALPKPISQLQGMNLNQIDPKLIFPNQPRCQNALQSALTIR